MSITGYDVSILPGLIFLGILPILFLINFLFNLFVFWLMLRSDKKKVKTSEILLPIFIHTILVGIIEVILLLVSYAISKFSYLSVLLYAIFSFVTIFFIFRMLIPRFIKLDNERVNKYALIMGIVTNPGFLFSVIIFLLYFISKVTSF
jgi:hypothetical protein